MTRKRLREIQDALDTISRARAGGGSNMLKMAMELAEAVDKYMPKSKWVSHADREDARGFLTRKGWKIRKQSGKLRFSASSTTGTIYYPSLDKYALDQLARDHGWDGIEKKYHD